MGWLLRQACSHNPERYVVRVDLYRNGEKDRSVYCGVCGKVIVPSEDFDALEFLLSEKVHSAMVIDLTDTKAVPHE